VKKLSVLPPPPAGGPANAAAPVRSSPDLRILSHYPQVRAIRAGALPFPRTAIIYPVYGCNLSCTGCEYEADNEAGVIHLPFETWTDLLDDLAAGGAEGIELCGGGEPMLHPRLVDAILHGARAGLRFGILTNGPAVDDRFQGEALRHCAYVRITIDAATPETYAQVRPSRGSVKWSRVLQAVERLVAARPRGTEISLKFLVNRVNRPEIEAAVALARRLGVDSLQFKATREHPAELSGAELDAAAAAIEAARREAAPFPVLGGVAKLTMSRRCELTPLQTTVDARGDVYLCCYFTHRRDRHRIGNVREQRFGALWGSPRHRQAIAALRPAECSVFDCRFVRYHDVLDAWDGSHGDGLSFL
jgi:radical SAM protein with 4Fe4S-binding SPASM domain